MKYFFHQTNTGLLLQSQSKSATSTTGWHWVKDSMAQQDTGIWSRKLLIRKCSTIQKNLGLVFKTTVGVTCSNQYRYNTDLNQLKLFFFQRKKDHWSCELLSWASRLGLALVHLTLSASQQYHSYWRRVKFYLEWTQMARLLLQIFFLFPSKSFEPIWQIKWAEP